MANFDHLAGTTEYEDVVIDGLTTAVNLFTDFDQFGVSEFHEIYLVN